MRVAIAGAGIAGGYLAALLAQREISADVYDGGNHATSCGFRSCGWGVPWGIRNYLAEVGLDLDDYLLEPMSPMRFEGLAARTPFCTVDKPRLLRDFTRPLRVTRHNLTREKAEDYDIVVDATGITRALLPPCRADLTLPTLQHRVVAASNGSERLGAEVYGNRIPGRGYLWIFPLGDNRYHIGVGGIGLDRHDNLLEQFYRDSAGRFSVSLHCSCQGSIRVASPYYSTPLYSSTTREDGTPLLIIGVGESIGTVTPFTGEGIVYSLQCARMLADSWPNPEEYARTVLSRFAWMRKERETLDYLLSPQGTRGPRLRDRWRFVCNARRSGIGLPLREAFTRMGGLSRWVENPEI